MKISIGANIKDGPWGGGNLFFKNLQNNLIKNGHEVTFNLQDNDIEVILMTDPRFLSESASFNHVDVMLYKKFINNNVKVVHRINECDERKNTTGLNKLIIKSSKIADEKVFVSSWLKKLYESQGMDSKNNTVILSGSDPEIFNTKYKKKWNKSNPLKIVTHHWGANWNKGFEVYKLLDDLQEDRLFSEKYTFTYIGNIPKNFKFKHSTHIQPLAGVELSKELQKHDLYITGSLHEPSGNHHIEGGLCGLPIMYISSGGIPEYTLDFGIEYTIKNFQESLEKAVLNYDKLYKKMENYSFTSKKMSDQYEDLFTNIIQNKPNVNINKIYLIIFRYYINVKLKIKKLIINDK